MKKIINISLWTIIFLLVATICVVSIKKYFDKKLIFKLDNILAVNYVSDFVSYNKIEEVINKTEIEIEKETIHDNIKNEIIEEKQDKNTQDIVIEEKEESEKIENEDKEEKDTDTNENSGSVLYDGLTEEALLLNLEKNLKNELSGTGNKFVEYYKNTGLDPYLAASIVLHETGCTWKCSSLVRECFNYGGMKGGNNKYKETNYTCYNSKEEGINAYLNMLYNNYFSKGLTTPELINPKYASSLEWAAAINRYIEKFKNS